MATMMYWMKRLMVAQVALAALAPLIALAQMASVADPYPGATMLPPGSIAAIAQPPGINSRIGPGATPGGVAFPVAGQLMQGMKFRATQSAPATGNPACSRGWVQVFALEMGQPVVGNDRDVWICRGDGAMTYATVSSPASLPITGQQDTIAPTTPVAIVVSPSGPNTVNLNWNPATDSAGSGLAGYKIERCAGQNCRDFREIASPAMPPYADNGLSPGTTYLYRIRAYDKAGNLGGYTGVALATTQPPAAALPDLVITELKAPASGVIGGNVNVSAIATNKGATATGPYRLAFYFSNDQSATTFSGTYCEMAPLAAGGTWPCSGTVALPSTLAAGNYWLVAFADDLGHVAEKDKSNNTGAMRIALTAAAAEPVPAPGVADPSALTASLGGSAAIRLGWTAPATGGSAVSGYKIERCGGSGCGNFVQIATSTLTSHTDSGLAAGTSYTYRVRAYDSAGNSSNYSNAASASTTPAAVYGDRINSQ